MTTFTIDVRENIASFIKDVATEWEIEKKLVVAFTDNSRSSPVVYDNTSYESVVEIRVFMHIRS